METQIDSEVREVLIRKALGKAITKLSGDAVPVGTHKLKEVTATVKITDLEINRPEGTAGEGQDFYKKTVSLSPKAVLAAAISFAGIQGENIEKFISQAMELSRLEEVSGASAIEGMRDVTEAMERVESITEKLVSTRNTRTTVKCGVVSIIDENDPHSTRKVYI